MKPAMRGQILGALFGLVVAAAAFGGLVSSNPQNLRIENQSRNYSFQAKTKVVKCDDVKISLPGVVEDSCQISQN